MLNAGGDGSVSGFTVGHDGLVPLAGSTRSLEVGNTNPPAFITSPAQIGFSADGRALIVTTKAHHQLLTFRVGRDGLPSAAPVVTASAGAVPFSFVVDDRGHVQVGRTIDGPYAGSGTLSSWSVATHGAATPTAPIAATTGAGPIDLAASRDGRFLYVQEAVAGSLGVRFVAADISLTRLQTVSGLPALTTTGMEGIAAS